MEELSSRVKEEFKKVKCTIGGMEQESFNSHYMKVMPSIEKIPDTNKWRFKNYTPSPTQDNTLLGVWYGYILNPDYCESTLQKIADEYNYTFNITDEKKKKNAKSYARTAYSFSKWRYSIESRWVDNEGNLYREVHNYAYIAHNGLQGFDIDFDKDKYTTEERIELGNRCKKIIHQELHEKWFAFVSLSTSGKGVHVWTAYQKPYYLESAAECKHFMELSYEFMLYEIMKILYKHISELSINGKDMNLSSVFDNAMYKPTQGINITIIDKEPLYNKDFEFCVNEKVVELMKEKKYHIEFNPQDIVYNSDEIQVHKAYENLFKLNGQYKKSERDENIEVHFKINSEFDLSKCKKPYHWHHNLIPDDSDCPFTISQAIQTLLCYYDTDTVCDIWLDGRFYDCDGRDNARWTRSFCITDENGNIIPKEDYTPNFALVNFLNNNCGFDLSVEYIQKEEKLEDKYESYHEIQLSESQFAGDKKDEILSCFSTGINMFDCLTGGGKTRLWIDIVMKQWSVDGLIGTIRKKFLIIEPYNSISKSKYPKEAEVIIESKYWPYTLTGDLYVTNYNKLKKLVDWDDKVLSYFDYIIVDESHLLLTEMYRSDTILPFIDILNKAKGTTKVIIQTATPLEEEYIFDISNYIKIIKPTDKSITINYSKFQPNKDAKIERFDLNTLGNMTRYFLNEGRKVYIYWPNLALNRAKAFQHINSDLKIAIYHKRRGSNNTENEDMLWIDSEHILGDKYDVLLSSCYFGVGNDLNDTCNSACIIVGNHPWSEEVQVIGRWRNSKDISAWVIYEEGDDLVDYPVDIKKIYSIKRDNLEKIWADKCARNGTQSIRNNKINIERYQDIDKLAWMETSQDYNSSRYVKSQKYSNYGIVYIPEKDNTLVYNSDWITMNKEFYKKLSEIRNEDKKETIKLLLENKSDKIVYTNEPKLDSWKKTLVKMYHNYHDLFVSEIDHLISYSMTKSIQMMFSLNDKCENKSVDMPELCSLYWYDKKRKENKDIWSDTIPGGTISIEDYYKILAYIVFAYYKSKDSEDIYILQGDYFNNYKFNCDIYCGMTDKMKETFLSKISIPLENDTLFKEDNLFNVEVIESSKICKGERAILFKKLLNRLSNKKSESGKKGGQVSKKVQHIESGLIFDSMTALAQHFNVSPSLITRWKKQKKLIFL